MISVYRSTSRLERSVSSKLRAARGSDIAATTGGQKSPINFAWVPQHSGFVAPIGGKRKEKPRSPARLILNHT